MSSAADPAAAASAAEPVLVADGLAVDYRVRRRTRRVVQEISFDMARGETVALVGESGSGKSTIAKALLGLAPVSAGSVRIDGHDLAELRDRRLRASLIQAVFQNPYGSLNPDLTVGQILAEPLQAVSRMGRHEAFGRIKDLLHAVRLPADAVNRYPAEFSGGQRQRIAIARALALRPKVIVCDEPTSALDVSTQARVLELLSELRRETGVSYLFITHDIALVREFADRVLVLEGGRIVERGTAADVCEHPEVAYTQLLVASVPVPDPRAQRDRREKRQVLIRG